MKTHLLHLVLLLAMPVAGFAQAGAAGLPTVTRFLSRDYRPATAADSDAYCVETIYRDSLGSGLVRVYYPSGKLKQYIPFANVARGVRHGCLTTWYENGQMCSKEDYLNGVRDGELITFYPNGALKRKEHYVNGRSGVGTCYDPKGRPVSFFAYEQPPLYPGGNEQLKKELARGVRLNEKEKRDMLRASALTARYNKLTVTGVPNQGWQRWVDIELAVGKDGRVTDARVVSSTAPFLNQAVLRAVAALTRTFVPAKRDGQVVDGLFVVPVKYSLDMPAPTYSGVPSAPAPMPKWKLR